MALSALLALTALSALSALTGLTGLPTPLAPSAAPICSLVESLIGCIFSQDRVQRQQSENWAE